MSARKVCELKVAKPQRQFCAEPECGGGWNPELCLGGGIKATLNCLL